MDERSALGLIEGLVGAAGDDAAVVGETVISTDMLHETTDFPDGTTRYTAGWRAVGASLSDIAAMGATPTAAVAVYGAPSFESSSLSAFLEGASDVCSLVGAEYVGGDLDGHNEFTVATTAIGTSAHPVCRSGATAGETVCVTGTFGRSAAALELFDADPELANELFRFEPRTVAGEAIAPHAGAMMDSSDGLARSLHQLAAASNCGISVRRAAIPIDDRVRAVADSPSEVTEYGLHFGEDFELVFTTGSVEAVQSACDVPVTPIGRVTDDDAVTIDGTELQDRGFTH
ncbi:thiamine-phosphate kinase [Halocatena halophila]|uniref:thiamine-phosphate kinase n=1 Tax=Halocatena halophila TaxID=2814576 RepID=UPI002ED48F8F